MRPVGAAAAAVLWLAGCAGMGRTHPPPAAPSPPGGNDCPIVLLHGAFGFGREELLGYPYWGGTVDLQEELRVRGFAVYTAAVGPVSSNWDRACELYACLKGGRVDYGAAHSARFGHERFGPIYRGLLPEWGEPDPRTGRPRKVHLVAHSLGGQTTRLLVHLLLEGSAEESSAAAQPSSLFTGGHDWVLSVTTISTPHDGTTATLHLDPHLFLFGGLLRLLLAVAGTTPDSLYDFRLGQWGLERRPGTSPRDYLKLVEGSAVWAHTQDTGLWDASPEGARSFNRRVPAHPEVFYFSWATRETCRDPFSGTQVPSLGMNPLLLSQARFLGSYTTSGEPGGVPIDSTWWPNDGIVNTCSMDGPTLGSRDRIVPWSPAGGRPPRRGVWNYRGVLESMDHLDIIGLDPLCREHPAGSPSLLAWYVSLATQLVSLPE